MCENHVRFPLTGISGRVERMSSPLSLSPFRYLPSARVYKHTHTFAYTAITCVFFFLWVPIFSPLFRYLLFSVHFPVLIFFSFPFSHNERFGRLWLNITQVPPRWPTLQLFSFVIFYLCYLLFLRIGWMKIFPRVGPDDGSFRVTRYTLANKGGTASFAYPYLFYFFLQKNFELSKRVIFAVLAIRLWAALASESDQLSEHTDNHVIPLEFYFVNCSTQLLVPPLLRHSVKSQSMSVWKTFFFFFFLWRPSPWRCVSRRVMGVSSRYR